MEIKKEKRTTYRAEDLQNKTFRVLQNSSYDEMLRRKGTREEVTNLKEKR